MPNFQPHLSLRKTRAAAMAALNADQEQRIALAKIVGQLNAQGAVLRRGFFGRLKWVICGLPTPKANGGATPNANVATKGGE